MVPHALADDVTIIACVINTFAIWVDSLCSILAGNVVHICNNAVNFAVQHDRLCCHVCLGQDTSLCAPFTTSNLGMFAVLVAKSCA